MSGEGNVSTLSPTLGQRQRAAALALLMACGCMLVLPLANVSVPRFESVVLILDTAFALLGLIVASLLLLQFRATRAPAVLALASGFLLLGLATVSQLLRESQGAFIDLRLMFIADFALAASAIAYALLRRGAAGSPDSGRVGRHIAGAIAFTVALAALATWITAASVEPGSGIPAAEAMTMWRALATTLLCATLAVAIALLWQRRSSVLDLWLLVTLTAWFIDALLRAAAPDDSSVTWHFARLYGLFGMGCVMFALLAENTGLFARLERPWDCATNAAPATSAHEAGVVDQIAEELAQPLCAITANADAIDRMLEQDEPELAEMRAALADIVEEAGRASRTLREARQSVAGTEAPGTSRQRPAGQ
jgi:hypothetical protein